MNNYSEFNEAQFNSTPRSSSHSDSGSSSYLYDEVSNAKKTLQSNEYFPIPPSIQFMPSDGTNVPIYINAQDGDDDERRNSIASSSSMEAIPKYDAFTTEIIERTNTGENKCYEITKQITKVVAYIVTFILVLSAATLAKGCLLFMTSQIRANNTTPYCYDSDQLESYQAVTNLAERSQWIWAIFFAYMVPEVWTVIRCALLVTFKTFETPPLKVWLVVGLFETLHTVGIALLVFVALPEMDVIKGAMLTNCTCIMPGVLMLISRVVRGDPDKNNESKKWWTKKRLGCTVIDVLALVAQLSGLVVWPLVDRNKLHYATWAIPAGVFLTSFGWWENYLDIKFRIRRRDLLEGRRKSISLEKQRDNPFVEFLRDLNLVKIHMNQKRSRAIVYVFMPIWKMAVFLGSMVGFVCLTSGVEGKDRFFIFHHFLSGKMSRNISVETTNVSTRLYESPHLDGSMSIFSVTPTQSTSTKIEADPMAAVATFIIQAVAAYMCYITGKYTCKVKIQTFSYAVPVTLAVPFTISILITFCGMKNEDVCFAEYVIPKYLYWVCPADYYFTDFLANDLSWVWIFWFLSQVWITAHIWTPKCDRLAPTELLYVTPMYSGMLADQSLSLNRRRRDGKKIKAETDINLINEQENMMDNLSIDSLTRETCQPPRDDAIPKIIACITMWHETENEMLQTLKSIMRMDVDHLIRRVAQECIGYVSQDYYTFEANIFMDNAFDYENKDIDRPVVNEYVERLNQLMNEAARKIYDNYDPCTKSSNKIWIGPPTIYSTPFGGRMIFELPGKTKLAVHMKDKQKIRIRKRWSQVMYMYYLLGYRLWNLDLEVDRLETKAKNTFILTLDGDIEFKPEAVLLLVDLMKKNSNLGAACGRIHPVGSGFMAWYQMFEYAIGHWLQKATEHVLGCVLCSPGCFSLFRAQALMEPNVMRTYTTPPTKPRHYVQYEQGEDRWLCTLLLQRGFRVEYAAAADAYTHCPESFMEFFNQRRRWVPSTMANIIDLLQTSRNTINNNDDISLLYICYQWALMASSILGPGTVFLMLVGSIVAAFGVAIEKAFWINLIPVILFFLVCMFMEQKYQLMLAGLLTCLYAILMMAVIVGILIEANVHGWLSPSSFFLLASAGIMIVTAILHPMEVFCIFCGVIYWVVIPSMYLLLIVYSVMNMNDVTWGVRENATAAAAQAKAEEAARAKKKNKGQVLLNNLLGNTEKDEDAGFTLSCANLFTCQICTHPKPEDELQIVMKKIDVIQAAMDSQLNKPRKSLPLLDSNDQVVEDQMPEESDYREKDEIPDGDESSPPDTTPTWMDKDCFKHAKHNAIKDTEVRFWEYMLQKYLCPIDENKKEQKKMRSQLRSLRNQSAFAFFMLNALFVVMVLLMQVHQDTLYLEYPDIGSMNISCSKSDSGENTQWTVDVEQNMLRLEPIGFVFLIMYAVILVLQFIAMLFHRFGTITLILATTSLNWFEKDNETKNNEKARLELQKEMARRLSEESGNSSDIDEPWLPQRYDRRQTISRLQEELETNNILQRRSETIHLEPVFTRRLTSIVMEPHRKSVLERRLTKPILKKVSTQLRRKSGIVFGSTEVVPRESGISFIDDDVIIEPQSRC